MIKVLVLVDTIFFFNIVSQNSKNRGRYDSFFFFFFFSCAHIFFFGGGGEIRKFWIYISKFYSLSTFVTLLLKKREKFSHLFISRIMLLGKAISLR